VALLDTPAGPLKRVHRHPDGEECFAPLFGDPCIAVASPEDPDSLRLFQLSEPFCIRRLVWHEVVSGQNSRVFIAENTTISGEDQYLGPVEWNSAL
jgi:ureidoglycolate hydrolase